MGSGRAARRRRTCSLLFVQRSLGIPRPALRDVARLRRTNPQGPGASGRLVPEVVPGDAEVGEHHAEEREADADDVVGVTLEAGDERASVPVDREAAGNGFGLAGGRVRLDLLLGPVSYTHLRAHETDSYLVCRLLLE